MVELLLFVAVVCASFGIVAVTCALFWYRVERSRLYQRKSLGRPIRDNSRLYQNNRKLKAINLAFKANDLA